MIPNITLAELLRSDFKIEEQSDNMRIALNHLYHKIGDAYKREDIRMQYEDDPWVQSHLDDILADWNKLLDNSSAYWGDYWLALENVINEMKGE